MIRPKITIDEISDMLEKQKYKPDENETDAERLFIMTCEMDEMEEELRDYKKYAEGLRNENRTLRKELAMKDGMLFVKSESSDYDAPIKGIKF